MWSHICFNHDADQSFEKIKVTPGPIVKLSVIPCKAEPTLIPRGAHTQAQAPAESINLIP